MAKIKLERFKCIGCGTCCSLCPKYFEMGEDGKSILKEPKSYDKEKNVEEKEIEEIDCARDAEQSCPASCIHIEQ